MWTASCTSTLEKAPSSGKFNGEPRMVPIAPNTFFYYQPKGKDEPFTFTTAAKSDSTATQRGRGSYRLNSFTIQPEPMITTGASVPRGFWILKGMSSFDFTRAALIHDWLYVAHHRYSRAVKMGDREGMKHYEKYASLTQEDAADIFAECIKVIMNESKTLKGELAKLRATQAGGDAAVSSNLLEIEQSLKQTQPTGWRLHAYHYFVSPDCIVPTSVEMWDQDSNDLALFRLFAEGETGDHAQKLGFITPWLRGRFKEMYQVEVERERKYQNILQSDQKAKEQGRQIPPRVYLEVADADTQQAIHNHRGDLKSQNFETLGTGFIRDLDAQELRVLYYRVEDQAEAEKLLALVLSWLPADIRPKNAGVSIVTSKSPVRPRHFDLRVGPGLATGMR